MKGMGAPKVKEGVVKTGAMYAGQGEASRIVPEGCYGPRNPSLERIMAYAYAVWYLDDDKLAYLMSLGTDRLYSGLVLSCGYGDKQAEGLVWYQEGGTLELGRWVVANEAYTRLEVRVPVYDLAKIPDAWVSPELMDGPGSTFDEHGRDTRGEAGEFGIRNQ
jgi:hypothetical protein